MFLLFASLLVFPGFEELLHPGYPFQTCCEGVGTLADSIIVSLIFSLARFVNPAFSILGGIFLFVHGLLYIVAYLKTCSLWTPIGLHMAWNFAQGPIAGMKVSGTSTNANLFLTQVKGPDVVTGGSFGVEGGLVAIFISAIVLLVLLKAQWLKPSERLLVIERKWANKNHSQENSSAG
ncbi:MAG: CPBP family intramembrane glutamic endopeptidase [Candidatus Zixiibacteriota bacterium]